MSAPFRVLVSVGSNVDPARWIPFGVERLRARCPDVAVSAWYRVPAQGVTTPQPDFVNGALQVRTALPARALRSVLRHVEWCAGRRRTADRFAPRTLDLDLVWGDASFLATCPAPLPASEVLDVPYVLIPAAEVGGDLCVPSDGDTLQAAAAALPDAARGMLIPWEGP